MILSNTENVYYKTKVADDEGRPSEIAINWDQIKSSSLELIQKNQEVSVLKQQLVEVLGKAWQSEQLISKLHRKVNNNRNFEDVHHLMQTVKHLINEFKFSNERKLHEHELVVDQDFTRKIQLHFPTLSSNDLRICSLLRLNLSTKEIALKLGISAESANKARYRIRKKLRLSKGKDLVHFIIKF